MFRQRIAALEILSLVGLTCLAVWYFPNVLGSQDTNVYARIARDIIAGGPVHSEYPPLITALFVLLEYLSFGLGFLKVWLPFLGVIVAGASLIIAIRGKAIPLLTATFLSTILLGPELLFARFDVLVFLCLFFCIFFQQRGKPFWSAAMLGVACSIKIVPLLLLPLLIAVTPAKKRIELTWGFIAGAAVSALIGVLVLGPAGFAENIAYLSDYHGSRGIQIESTWSSIDLFLRQLFFEPTKVEFHSMSAENMGFGRGMPLVASLLVFGGTAWIALTAWWSKKKPSFATAALATLLWILAVSPILSPQYLVWVLPVLFAMAVEAGLQKKPNKRIAAVLLIAAIAAGMTQWVFPHHYGHILDQSSLLTITILLLRNVALFGLLATLFWYEQWAPTALPPAPKPKKSWKKPTTYFAVGLALLCLMAHLTKPSFGPVDYRFEGGESQTGTLPLFPDSQGSHMDVTVPMILGALHPTVFRVKPDDCLESMTINEKPVDPALVTYCDYGNGRNLDLGEYLHSGVNVLSMRIRDDGGLGGVNITVARTDPLMYALFGALALLLCWFGFTLARHPRIAERRGLWFIFLSGVLLRILYVMGTPFGMRGHDTEAHIDYIQYIAQHWTIPLAIDGWEYHQPPLYYYLTAVWMRAMQFFERPESAILQDIQTLSLLFSIAALAAAYLVARVLFPKGDGKASLFLGLVAVLPSLVFNASRISNDTLYTFLAFTAFALLLIFWKKPKLRTWYILCALLGLMALTKVSAYALIVVCFLCFLAAKMPIRKKMTHAAASAVLILAMFAWHPILRLNEPDPTRTRTLGNHGMHSGLLLDNALGNYMTFNPVALLRAPYNNPWDDATRRKNFLEYFFRSSLTGEFGFEQTVRWVNIILVFASMLLLPLLLWGTLRTLWKQPIRSLPLWLTLGALCAGSLAYRVKFPYASNQDFRFALLLILPIAYFLIQGTTFKSKRGTLATRIPLFLFLGCSTLFLVLISIEGT